MVREDSQRDEALTRIAGDLFQTFDGRDRALRRAAISGLQSAGSVLPKFLGLYESELHAALGVARALPLG